MSTWADAEQLMLHDPQGRGVSALYRTTAPAGAGLEQAVQALTGCQGEIWLVTGFPVQTPDGWCAETDGPPGTLALAWVLHELGYTVRLLADEIAASLMMAGAAFWKLPMPVEVCPFEPGGPESPARCTNLPGTFTATDAWIDGMLASPGADSLAALIAIETPGPSHTPETLGTSNPDTAEQFRRIVPPAHWNICHNMRGLSVNAYTGKLHRLFDRVAADRPNVLTIGIGDGGNEIGMGSYTWSELAIAIGHGPGTQTASRLATNHLLVGGTSNWAAYALATMLAWHQQRNEVLADLEPERLSDLIHMLVNEAGAVDGLLRERRVTVDGMPLTQELEIYSKLRMLAVTS